MTVFFFASAAASSAYLTVSEIFPLEIRALAIAFFYAIGTGIGGIAGPLLFGVLINTGSRGSVAIGYVLGAVLMVAAAVGRGALGHRCRAQIARNREPAACIHRLKSRISNVNMEPGHFGLSTWSLRKSRWFPTCDKCAILLDIDGTILDLAPSPQQVWVPPGLRRTLARLDDLTGGAVALVSGRSLADIDLIFSPLQLAAIGGHGAELRAAATPNRCMRVAPLSAASSASSPASPSSVPAFLPRTRAIRWRCTIGWRQTRQMRCAPRSRRSAPARRPARSRFCPANLSSRSSRPASTRPMRCAS